MNHLARRGRLQPGGELFGKAFENWVLHELLAYNAYHESFAELSYWRLASGIEVDFIVGQMNVAIEAKATARITSRPSQRTSPPARRSPAGHDAWSCASNPSAG